MKTEKFKQFKDERINQIINSKGNEIATMISNSNLPIEVKELFSKMAYSFMYQDKIFNLFKKIEKVKLSDNDIEYIKKNIELN